MDSSFTFKDQQSTSKYEYEVETLFEVEESLSSSSTEPPMEEWSSLLIPLFEENKKMALYRQGLYTPSSGEVCAKYIPLSDSSVFRHPYYKYPAVIDPGILPALEGPNPEKKYDEVGQALYLELCDDTGMAPVRIFYRGLLKNVINLKYYCVNPNGVRNMCLALTKNNIVKSLDLTSSFLNNDACFHLGELLATTSTLQELILTQCRIGYFGLMRLLEPLNDIDLKYLDLSKNVLGNDGMALIAPKIINGAKIKKLNLSHNDIAMNGILHLAKSLNYNKTCFTHLNLSWNVLASPKALRAFITSIYDHPKLIELNLSWCGISGGKYLADLLMAKSLQTLDLSNNNLSALAVAAIRTKLRTTPSLRILNLSSNPLRPKEAYDMLRELRFQQVKLTALLMDEIDVSKEFPVVMKRILSLKHREDTTVTHGRVMGNYTLHDADFRDIVVKRLDYLSRKGPKRKRFNFAEYVLQKSQETNIMIPRRMMMDFKQMAYRHNVNMALIEKLPIAFPGPRIDKYTRAIDMQSLSDYVARIWPEARAPLEPLTIHYLNPIPTGKSLRSKKVHVKSKVAMAPRGKSPLKKKK